MYATLSLVGVCLRGRCLSGPPHPQLGQLFIGSLVVQLFLLVCRCWFVGGLSVFCVKNCAGF